jgi:hypothetical protein
MMDYWNLTEAPARNGEADTVHNWPIDVLGDVAVQTRTGGLVNGQP